MKSARRLTRAAGTIATPVLIDSAMEHDRAAFSNKALYTPIAVSALSISASFPRPQRPLPCIPPLARRRVRPAGATGAAGTAFHFYHVTKRPGTVPTVAGLPVGRVVSALTGIGLLGTTAEVGLLHFRGAFHNPAMLPPVTGVRTGIRQPDRSPAGASSQP